MAGGKPGNIAAVQGKDEQKNAGTKFIEERKENRAMLGQQVVNGFGSGAPANNAAAKR